MYDGVRPSLGGLSGVRREEAMSGRHIRADVVWWREGEDVGVGVAR